MSRFTKYNFIKIFYLNCILCILIVFLFPSYLKGQISDISSHFPIGAYNVTINECLVNGGFSEISDSLFNLKLIKVYQNLVKYRFNTIQGLYPFRNVPTRFLRNVIETTQAFNDTSKIKLFWQFDPGRFHIINKNLHSPFSRHLAAKLFKFAREAGIELYIWRFLVWDEPKRSNFDQIKAEYEYIDSLSNGKISGICILTPRGISIPPRGESNEIDEHPLYVFYEQYLASTGAKELFIDPYLLDTRTLSPFSQSGYPIDEQYLPDNINYRNYLEERIDNITYELKVVQKLSNKHQIPFYSCVQAHAYMDRYNNRIDSLKLRFREPTRAELRLQVNLSLCYGAKGIFYYPYFTHRFKVANENGLFNTSGYESALKNRPWNDRTRFNKPEYFQNDSGDFNIEEAVRDETRSLNQRLQKLSPILLQLIPDTTLHYHGGELKFIKRIYSHSTMPNIEVSVFKSQRNDTFSHKSMGVMIVNRDCTGSGYLDISIETDNEIIKASIVNSPTERVELKPIYSHQRTNTFIINGISPGGMLFIFFQK